MKEKQKRRGLGVSLLLLSKNAEWRRGHGKVALKFPVTWGHVCCSRKISTHSLSDASIGHAPFLGEKQNCWWSMHRFWKQESENCVEYSLDWKQKTEGAGVEGKSGHCSLATY